ncbi:MAG: DNA polymerase Y family protein [Halothiobacillaceae bacterium]|nr:DNA polymerase Y family protein [Halothiobacillaceae bacterium]
MSTSQRSVRGESFWLALRFPEAWFECRCPEDDRHHRPPAVLLIDKAGRSRVVAANRPAQELGIAPGQSLAIARSRHRDAASTGVAPLRCLSLDEAAIADWLAQWGEWSGQFTSRVTCPPGEGMPGLLLELGGSAALFGGLSALTKTVVQALAERHLVVRAAGAPHPRIAWALAAVADESRAWLCDRRHQVTAVGGLSLAALERSGDWPEDWIRRFKELGLERLAEVRRLPRDGLAMRAESALLVDLDRLFAERDWPLPDLELPTRYAREVSLWDPAGQVDRLLLIARAPMVGLVDFLRLRGLATAWFRVVLGHEVVPPTEVAIATAEPGRDERLWLAQLRLRLESIDGMRPVTWLRVEADRFVTPASGQGSLFADGAERARDEQALWHRLQARLGEAGVGRLQWATGLVPPSCSRIGPIGSVRSSGGPVSLGIGPFRPLWWLEKARRPEAPIRHRGEAERVETGWWSVAEETADYCAGELAGGRAVCLRREHGRDEWDMIGLDG